MELRGPEESECAAETLENYSLNLIECDLIVAAVVELLRPRALVRGHLLSVFQQAAVEKIDGDPRRPKRVAAELGGDAGRERAPHDHSPRVLPRHPRFAQLLSPATAERAEQ